MGSEMCIRDSTQGHLQVDAQLKRAGVQIAAASVVMGGVLFWLNQIVDKHLWHGFFERGIWLGVLVGGGGLVYLVSGFIFGALRLGDVRLRFLRGR